MCLCTCFFKALVSMFTKLFLYVCICITYCCNVFSIGLRLVTRRLIVSTGWVSHCCLQLEYRVEKKVKCQATFFQNASTLTIGTTWICYIAFGKMLL